MRWRCVPSPTKDEPLRIGFPTVGMHLRPHRRVDAVRADQQRAGRLRARPVGVLDQRADAAVGILGVAGDAAAEPHCAGTGALDQPPIEQHMEMAAVHRILRPVVAGEFPARLRIDVVAVEGDQRPFLRRHADAVEIALREAEIGELAHGVGLHIDADAERAQFARRLEHDAGYADLVQRQRGGEPADAPARDQHWMVRRALHCPRTVANSGGRAKERSDVPAA
jgi:hypothetical protein